VDGAQLGRGRRAGLAVALLTGLTACGSSAAPTGMATPAAVTATTSATASTPAPATPSSQRCPADPEDLGGSTSDEAFAAVVRFNEQDPDFDPSALRRDSVAVAPEAGARGGQVLTECGPGVAERTFVVETTRTDLLPAQSASQGVYFVSRVGGQLVVWEQAH
jgi:hypothetical protein